MDLQELVMFLVVRKDLKMQTGKIAAQCAHAAEHLALETPTAIRRQYRNYYGNPKVVLQVTDLRELENIENECIRENIQTYRVIDRGLTQVPSGTCTVLGIGPVRRVNVPSSVVALKLL